MPLLPGFGPWWFGWVWSHLLPLILSEAPPVSLKHTRIQTTAMTHHSNISVRDHMKWVSGSHFISRITILMPVHFSVTSFLNSLSFPQLLVSVRSPLMLSFCADMLFCITRLGWLAVRLCCRAWPSCKPTIFQAKRGWHQPWVKGTGPVLRVTRPKHSTATTTMVTRFLMYKPTTATWAIHQLEAVHP